LPKASSKEFGLHSGGKGEPVPLAMAFGLYEVFSGLMLHADLHEGSARDRDVRSLLAWRPVKSDAALIESAWMLADRYGFS
jgi:hypothetical protein